MASIDLELLWIHLASDLSDFVTLFYADERITPARKTDVRAYAGGRMRAITTPTRTRQGKWSIGLLSDGDRATLEGWLGQLVMVRSPSSEKFFGVMEDLEADHIRKRGDWNATLTVTMVTHDESV